MLTEIGTAAASLRSRGMALLGRVSMYRLVLASLALLGLAALVASFAGAIAATPQALLASAAVLLAGCLLTDWAAHAIVRRPVRFESSAITALLLLFVLNPTTEHQGLALLLLAAVTASASKYLIAWRGRHLFNPAALGAAVVTLSGLSASMWWVGTPTLAAVVVVLGVLIAWRADELRVAALFVLVATAVGFLRMFVTASQHALAFDPLQTVQSAALSSPVLFLGLFMLTEPLTLPGRTSRRLIVAAVVGVMVGWPVTIGSFFLLPEAALLVGNLLAFVLEARSRAGVRLRLEARRALTPSITELTFRTSRPLSVAPGQFLELEVAHRHPDARGTRREFSVVPGPSRDTVRIAYRTPSRTRVSSFKRALALAEPGRRFPITGVRGDFLPPREPRDPVVLVAAGIGVTPFVAHLCQPRPPQDAVLILLA